MEVWSTTFASTLILLRSIEYPCRPPGRRRAVLGNGPGFESVGAHGGHQELPLAEQHFILCSPHLLHEAQAGTIQFKYLRGYPQLVVKRAGA